MIRFVEVSDPIEILDEVDVLVFYVHDGTVYTGFTLDSHTLISRSMTLLLSHQIKLLQKGLDFVVVNVDLDDYGIKTICLFRIDDTTLCFNRNHLKSLFKYLLDASSIGGRSMSQVGSGFSSIWLNTYDANFYDQLVCSEQDLELTGLANSLDITAYLYKDEIPF